ncbi:MAG: hypothetical protein FJ100_19785 [Deltaproteobacteria bacterium]|nr:hypothetical protein [Deltaproteobacteria bacterium]
MKTEIEKAGLKVNLVVVNLIGTQDSCANLIEKGDFPILQDTDAVKAWNLHGGGKDDIIIYSKTGKLTSYYPFGGAIYTALSDPDAYALIKQKWVDADKAP